MEAKVCTSHVKLFYPDCKAPEKNLVFLQEAKENSSRVLKQQNKSRRFMKKRGRRRQHHTEITIFNINEIQILPELWSLSVYLYLFIFVFWSLQRKALEKKEAGDT